MVQEFSLSAHHLDCKFSNTAARFAERHSLHCLQ